MAKTDAPKYDLLMSENDFRKKFERLINTAWGIQRRIHELEEFERQWQTLFTRLKQKTGADCRVKVLNWDVYHSFRWDKYHVVLSDLLSAIENEIQNEFSVCRQAVYNLRIHPVETYVDRNQRVNFIYPPDFPVSEEDEKRREEEIQNENGDRLRNHCIEAMRSLFPDIKEVTIPSANDVETLKGRLRSSSQKINSARQVFAHKHQELIVRKHNVGLGNANIQQLDAVFAEFFQIVRDIGMISHQASYADLSPINERQITDQIDLILFGSISSIHLRYYRNIDPGTRYNEARNSYFESEDFFSSIVEQINSSHS